MEGQKNNQTKKEHSVIEMTCFRPPEQPTKPVGLFPGCAKRLGSDNQRSERELHGHQVVRYNPPIHDHAMHGIIISGMNHYPGATTSGQSNAQESDQLFPGNILHVRNARDESYCLEMRKSNSLTDRRKSAQMPDRDCLDSETVSEYKTCNGETTDDESYFLAESELQLHPSSNHADRLHSSKTESSQEFVYSSKRKPKRKTKQKYRYHKGSKEVDNGYGRSYLTNYDNTSELSLLGISEPESQDYFPSIPRWHLTNSEPTQALVDSSILNSYSATKQHCANDGESPDIDGEFWRRNYFYNDDITLELSCLEQGLPEPKRQWHRCKNMRLQNSHSPTRNYSCRLLLYLSIICFLSAILLFAFVVLFVSFFKYV